MITIKTIDAATFSINALPYQKGSAFIIQNADLVSLGELYHDSKLYVDKVDFSEWRDQADDPFANVDDLLLYLGQTIMS